MCEPMGQGEETGAWRHLKLSFGGGDLRTERNSKTSEIRDFRITHPSKNNFYGIPCPGNRNFGAVRFVDFRMGPEIFELGRRDLEGNCRDWRDLEGNCRDFRDFQEILKNLEGF